MSFTYQGDQVGEGQLDLNLQFVLRPNHRANIFVVVFEQVFDQLWLLIGLHCMEKEDEINGFNLFAYLWYVLH